MKEETAHRKDSAKVAATKKVTSKPASSRKAKAGTSTKHSSEGSKRAASRRRESKSSLQRRKRLRFRKRIFRWIAGGVIVLALVLICVFSLRAHRRVVVGASPDVPDTFESVGSQGDESFDEEISTDGGALTGSSSEGILSEPLGTGEADATSQDAEAKSKLPVSNGTPIPTAAPNPMLAYYPSEFRVLNNKYQTDR